MGQTRSCPVRHEERTFGRALSTYNPPPPGQLRFPLSFSTALAQLNLDMKFAPKVIGDEKLDSWYPCSFNSSQPYVTGVGQSAIQGLYPPSVAVAIGSPGNLHLNPASVVFAPKDFRCTKER